MDLGLYNRGLKYGLYFSWSYRSFDHNDQKLDQDGLEISNKELTDYANAIDDVIRNKKWENVSLDLEKHSWNSVSDEWIKCMELI